MEMTGDVDVSMDGLLVTHNVSSNITFTHMTFTTVPVCFFFW